MTLPAFLLCSMTITIPSLKPQPVVPPAVDFIRLVEAIKQAENTPTEHVGSAGERSAYQITRDVWVKYSAMPFEHASSTREICRAEAGRVALCHVVALSVELRQAAIAPTPYSLALAWGAGATATITRSASARKREYAVRAGNLYGALRR